MFRDAGKNVIQRNQELAAITEHAATADVSTEKDKGVLWAGNSMVDHPEGHTDENGQVKKVKQYAAMLTAQEYARSIGGKTVEMTDAGKGIEDHLLFADLKERFQYLFDQKDLKTDGEFTSSNSDKALENRQHTEATANTTGGSKQLKQTLMKAGFGDEAYNLLSEEERENLIKGNAAGRIWDIVSRRFAEGFSGSVVAVHALPREAIESLLNGPPANAKWWLENTYNNEERPRVLDLLKNGNVTEVIDQYMDKRIVTENSDNGLVETTTDSDMLQPHLQHPTLKLGSDPSTS